MMRGLRIDHPFFDLLLFRGFFDAYVPKNQVCKDALDQDISTQFFKFIILGSSKHTILGTKIEKQSLISLLLHARAPQITMMETENFMKFKAMLYHYSDRFESKINFCCNFHQRPTNCTRFCLAQPFGLSSVDLKTGAIIKIFRCLKHLLFQR